MPVLPLLDPTSAVYDRDRSLLVEVINNFALGYELLRELISNAWDAEARRIAVVFTPEGNGVTVHFWDDGHGMVDPAIVPGFYSSTTDPIRGMFRLTESAKKAGVRSVGRKGLGSKIGLLSTRLEVESIFRDADGQHYVRRAACTDPWTRLSTAGTPVTVDITDAQPITTLPDTFFNGIPTAVRSHITNGGPDQLTTGTRVTVKEFQHAEFVTVFGGFGANFQRALDDVQRYMQWHTAAGTLKPQWDPAARRLEVHLGVKLGAAVYDNRGFIGAHDVVTLTPPYPAALLQQVTDPPLCGGGAVPPIIRTSKLFAKKVPFGEPNQKPHTFTLNVPGHGQVTVNIVAWVIGEFSQEQKLWGEMKPRDLFGLNLASHGFIVERKYLWVTNSPINNYYHVVLNCDGLELNADRTRVRASHKPVLDTIRTYFEQEYQPDIEKVARDYRTQEAEEKELERLYTEDCNNAKNRVTAAARDVLTGVCTWPGLTIPLPEVRIPAAEVDVVGILYAVATAARELLPFDPMAMFPKGSDLVARCRSLPPTDQTVEIEMRLRSFFKHGHSGVLLHGIACWEIDGPAVLRNGRETRHDEGLHRRLPAVIGGQPHPKPFWTFEAPPAAPAGQANSVWPYRVMLMVSGSSTNVPVDLASGAITVVRRFPVLVVSELLKVDLVAVRARLADPQFSVPFGHAFRAWWDTRTQNPILVLPAA